MKSQVLHTVWCYISGEAAGEIWKWSLLGVKGLKTATSRPPPRIDDSKMDTILPSRQAVQLVLTGLVFRDYPFRETTTTTTTTKQQRQQHQRSSQFYKWVLQGLRSGLAKRLQSTLSKRTLSKADTSLRRTANLVPAEFYLSLCNFSLRRTPHSTMLF